MRETINRRRFVGATLLAGGGLLIAGCPRREVPTGTEQPAEFITPGEDLMREHGVLERLLLIYEEIARRQQRNDPQWPALATAAGLIKRFIEDYHEKLEEEHVFPVLQRHGEQALAATLRAQHEAGRGVTARLIALAAAGGPPTDEASGLMRSFVRMYWPHAAREDTVAFPAFAEDFDPHGYIEMGELFERREHELLGEGGFENTVTQAATLEQSLGLYDLAQYTPRLPATTRPAAHNS